MSNTIDGEVLTAMPLSQEQGTAMVTANPFERMALAMVTSGGDMANLEKLLELQQKWDAEQARKAYYDAMAMCQAAMPLIRKNKRNEQTKSRYASLEAVAEAAQPVYTAHGFGLSFNTDTSKYPHHVLVTCRCTHKAGHSEHFEYDQPLDDVGIGGNKNKTPTHARGSAISYGRRYLTMMVFNLATRDDDDGNAATQQRRSEPRDNRKEEPEPDNEAQKLERKRQYFREAHAANSESMTYIKERIDAGDIKAAAGEWFQFSQNEQMALFLAPTKAGDDLKPLCFTTKQREVIKNEFSKHATKGTDE